LRKGRENTPFLTCLAAALTTAMETSPAPRVPTSALPSDSAASAPEGSFHVAVSKLPSDREPSLSLSEDCED